MIKTLPSVLPVSAQKIRVAIVAARYNSSIADTLLDHTLRTLTRFGVRQVKTVRVPGSYEVPVVVAQLARFGKFHVIIALGVVLQGKTSHADHIAQACAVTLQQIMVETGVPVIHQILTPRNLRDARARVRLRGIEAAQTAIEMAVTMNNVKCKM